MRSISSRRVLLLFSLSSLVLLSIRLFFSTSTGDNASGILRTAVQRYLPTGSQHARLTVIQVEENAGSRQGETKGSAYQQAFWANGIPAVDPLVGRLLGKCECRVNEITGHVRLDSRLVNISLVPEDDGKTKAKEKRWEEMVSLSFSLHGGLD
jgi:hypothetical protein